MAKQPLKNHENMEQMRTVQRAIERVSLTFAVQGHFGLF